MDVGDIKGGVWCHGASLWSDANHSHKLNDPLPVMNDWNAFKLKVPMYVACMEKKFA